MRRAIALALCLLGLLCSLFLATRSGPSETPTIEQLLEPKDLEEIARFREVFGSEPEMVLVALSRPGRERLARVEEDLRRIEGVKGTWSSLSRPRVGAGGPRGPLVSLFEPDASTSLILVALEPDAMLLSRARPLAAAMRAAVGADDTVLGAPQVRVASWEVVRHDLLRMVPLLALVVLAVPLLLFGSLGAALFPLALAALTTSVTLLAYRLFSGPLDALVMLLVPMVWSVATLDAMHVYACVRRRGPGSERKVLLPCFVNTLTTAGALAALSVQDEPRLLRAFGFWGTFGTCVAYVLTFALARAMLPGPRRSAPRWPGRLAATAVRFSERRPRATLVAWGLLLVAAAALALQLRVGMRYPDVFAGDQPVARELSAMREATGTDLAPLEIHVEATDEHGRRPGPLANAVLAVSHYLRTLPETRFVLPRDMLDVGPVAAGAQRPGALDEALANLAADPQVQGFVRFDLGAARVQAHFAPHSFARREEILEWVRHFGATMLSHHRLSLGGPASLYARAERRGVSGALVGGAISLVVILGALVWAFRRPRVLLAAVVGNVAPLLLVAGLMGVLGIPWSLAMLPLPAVLLGLAVDDTFHMLWPLRGRAGRPSLLRSALRNGPPVLATTAVLAGSMATLQLSGLQPNRELGLLLSAGLALALACDVSLVPALLRISRCR